MKTKPPNKKQLEKFLIRVMGYHEYICGTGERKQLLTKAYIIGFRDGQKL